jgi:F-type H+-transporting ATPase subunit delta
MRDHKVAARYAAALLIAARDAGEVEGIGETFAAVREAVRGNVELRTFLESPQVAEDEKRSLLRRLLADRVEPLFLNFVLLLVDKNRIEYFGDIYEEYALLVERERGIQRAKVTTAIELAADLEDALRARLAALTGRTIALEKRIDPEVLGGVCVVMGDQIIDGTVRANLDRVRKQLKEAPVR